MTQQQAFWLSVAKQALAAYPLTVKEIHWVSHTNNIVVSVQTQEADYYLRLNPQPKQSLAAFTGEAVWLEYLDQQGLRVPLAVSTTTGDLFVALEVNDMLTVATLFHALQGESTTLNAITTQQLGFIGNTIARLHQASQQFEPPENFVRPRLDWVGLFGDNSPYHIANPEQVFTTKQRKIFAAVGEQTRSMMSHLAPIEHSFGMLHGDMLCKNILFENEQVALIDFEYSGWGYYLYDLAAFLWQLKTDQPRYTQRLVALWQAYCHVLPDMLDLEPFIETMIATRQLASCYWLAGNLDNPIVQKIAPELIEERSSELRVFLENGTLWRTSITL